MGYVLTAADIGKHRMYANFSGEHVTGCPVLYKLGDRRRRVTPQLLRYNTS